MASFLLHHQHLSSTIKTSLHVPRGEFQGLKCQVNILYRNGSIKVSNSNQKRGGTQRYNLQNLSSRAAGGGGEGDGDLADSSVSDTRIDPNETSHLLNAALRRLIGVGKRGVRGIRTVKRSSSPSLIGVAPAVWNLNYLRVSYLYFGLKEVELTNWIYPVDDLPCRRYRHYRIWTCSTKDHWVTESKGEVGQARLS